MKAALLLCVLTASAVADPKLDLDQHTAAGNAYLDRYQADPTIRDGDELLYNAGVAFESGGALGAAIQAFTLLNRQYPNGRIAPRSLARLGRIYANVAMYDKAAEKLEEYAKKYAGEKDAVDAMSDAIYYRKAIGDRDKAIANTRYFMKTYGAKKPREAAEASWSLTALYETDPEQALAHLREYLRTYGTKGGAGRVVIAHAKIGALLWKQSCPHAGVDGLCVKTTERAPRTCGRGTTRTLTVTIRGASKRTEALAAFAQAIKDYEVKAPTDDAAARYYYAQAKLAIADAELEPYLAVALPSGLSVISDRPDSKTTMKKFNEWMEQKQKSGAKLTRDYEAVLMVKDAASSITVAARLGILTQSFATTLVTAEVPRDVRTGPASADRIKAFCDAFARAAEPLEARAVEAFAVCLAKSTELAWFGESSMYCERELIRMKPAEFPRANELRIQPLLAAPLIASEPPPQ